MTYVNINQSFLKLKKYCEKEEFKGWDPYDGLNSWVIQRTFLGRSRFIRLAWIQLFKRNPINLRPFFGIKKEYNPKGLALFLIGYCNLFKTDSKDCYYKKIIYLADKILELQTKGYSGSCWGYNFDWQARAFFQPKFTPTVVVTAFVTEALIEAYDVTNNERYINAAISSSKFVLYDLNRTYDAQGNFTFSYSPLDKTQVLNAGLLGAKLLSQVYAFTKDAELVTPIEKVVSYVSQFQKENGSWPYSTLSYHQWIDNFHTGYNLECLKVIENNIGNSISNANIKNGMTYYLETFFDNDGKSKYYHDKTYPIDIHAPAQLIVTLYKNNIFDQHRDLIKKVLGWTINNMQTNKGFFIYQKRKFISSRISYIRWAQSWMFYAFSYYILNEKQS
jgi:hypothetical protein